MIRAVLDPPDACPSCQPGIPDASLPAGPVEPAGDGTIASYECVACGTAWSTLFDAHGWPVERATADLTGARSAA